MADPVLIAACDAYLLGRGLPRAAPDVTALAAFVTAQAAIAYGKPHANEAVADPGLAAQVRRPR